MNPVNDIWLDRLVPNPPVRKCGHCQKTGHMMWDCEDVHILWDNLYMEMEITLEENPLGYRLEQFVESLTAPYLKIVYKMLCKKTMKKKEASVYAEILDALQILHPEYPGKHMRRVRLYENAYRSVETDAQTNQNGRCLQSYIHRLSSFEMTELTVKIRKTDEGGNWIGRDTYIRELRYLRDSPAMNPDELCIHCHFSEMGLGYHFTVREYSQNVRPVEAFIWLNDKRKTLQMDKMVRGFSCYSKTILLEEAPSLSECSMDCVVCMESKPDKQYVQFNCSHEFCGSCVGHMMATGVRGERDSVCPLCRAPVFSMVYKKINVMVEMREIIIA